MTEANWQIKILHRYVRMDSSSKPSPTLSSPTQAHTQIDKAIGGASSLVSLAGVGWPPWEASRPVPALRVGQTPDFGVRNKHTTFLRWTHQAAPARSPRCGPCVRGTCLLRSHCARDDIPPPLTPPSLRAHSRRVLLSSPLPPLSPPAVMRVGVNSAASGSSYVEFGSTKVMAAV